MSVGVYKENGSLYSWRSYRANFNRTYYFQDWEYIFDAICRNLPNTVIWTWNWSSSVKSNFLNCSRNMHFWQIARQGDFHVGPVEAKEWEVLRNWGIHAHLILCATFWTVSVLLCSDIYTVFLLFACARLTSLHLTVYFSNLLNFFNLYTGKNVYSSVQWCR